MTHNPADLSEHYQLCTCGNHLWSSRARRVMRADAGGTFWISSRDGRVGYRHGYGLRRVAPQNMLMVLFVVAYYAFMAWFLVHQVYA